MQTITFFSYKGGTGRSLAVANAACYLTQLGFRVAVLDFDLEAPGLAYKFSAAEDGAPIEVKRGLVDYLFSLVIEGQRPSSLSDYFLEVRLADGEANIVLIPAGEAPSTRYWEKLCQLDWHELFYTPDARGVQLFLDLKIRIQEELQPDFLLIDSRTGVTEMGGVATTILADVVVCILLNNRENMEGARTILRSLRRSLRKNGEAKVSILTALSQVPELEDCDEEQAIVEKIRTFLCEEAERLEDTLSLKEMFVLHSEPALQLRESLRIGKGISLDQSVLLRDYLRLFSQIVPAPIIEPRIGNLFESAKCKIWNDPDAATREMEQLAEFYGRPEGFRELLRLYLVRNIGGIPALKTAQRYWELSHDAKDMMVQRIVAKYFEEIPRWRSEWKPRLDFVEIVWRGAEKQDVELGERLAESYANIENTSKAAEIYLQIIGQTEQGEKYAGRCLELLVSAQKKIEAKQVIEKFKKSGIIDGKFLSAWAEFALSEHDIKDLEFLSGEPMIVQLIEASPRIALRVSETTGRKLDLEKHLERLLARATERGPSNLALELADIYTQLDKFGEYERKVRQFLSAEDAESLLRETGRRARKRHYRL